MKQGILAMMLLFAASGVMAQDVPDETVMTIQEMLAAMQCEMDPGDIEPTEGGFELDDVFCTDGQYDIELDADLAVVEKRKE